MSLSRLRPRARWLVTRSPNNEQSVTTEDMVKAALTQVIDPELGINVVELGMVGEIEIAPEHVLINLRLTSMSCPFWDLFAEQVRAAVGPVIGTHHVTVQFDRREPWSPDLMSDSARRQLASLGLMPPMVRQRSGISPTRSQLLQITNRVLSELPMSGDQRFGLSSND